ncbi:hypothetical protein BKA80DRAFT_313035 [Phyllosticta citrichinensis]
MTIPGAVQSSYESAPTQVLALRPRHSDDEFVAAWYALHQLCAAEFLSTDKYWWKKIGKDPAQADQEYLFTVSEAEDDDGTYAEEQPYPSFESAIKGFGNKSLVVNATCTISMTGKVSSPVVGVPKDTEYRARINISSATIVDITGDMPKPESSFRGGSTRIGVARGTKQKPRGNLAKMMGNMKVS